MASRSAPASLVLLVSVFLLSGPLWHAEPVAQQVATIASDLPEYSPGDTVTLTGGGWTPQETVTIVLQRQPLVHPDTVLTAVADVTGAFALSSFSPALDEIGVTFFVTASGSVSGLHAFTTFDAKKKKLTWSGAVSTDWNTVGNWDKGVPTASEEAQIPAGRSRYPVIDSNVSVGTVTLESGTGALLTVSGGTLSVSNDITLETGATFNQSGGTVDTGDFVTAAGSSSTQSGGTLRIFRDFKNSGTFNATAGTIVFAANGKFDSSGTNQFFNVVVDSAGYNLSDNTADIRVRGDWTMDGVGNLQDANNSVTFNGSGAQTITGAVATTFRHLAVDKPSGAVTLARSALVANGDMKILSGTLDLATFTLDRSAPLGGIIQVSNGAFLKIGGTNSFPAGYAVHTFQPASTVDYYGTNQTVTSETYGNLNLSTSGTKTMPATPMTIQGNFTMSGTASATAAQSLTVNGNFTLGSGTTFGAGASAFVHTVRGNFSNSGTFTASLGTFAFKGTGIQTIGGSNSTTFNSLNIDNPAGVALNGVNTTVNGILSLTSGTVTTGPSQFIATSATANVSRTSGHVVGNFQKFVATGAPTLTYEIGDRDAYTPVTVAFASVSAAGTLTGSTTPGDHPNAGASPVDRLRSVNRYWTFTNSGLSFTNYNATFNFVAGDLDAGVNTSAFIVGKFSGGSWTTPTVGVRTSGSTQITGVTSFSDFEIGEGGQGTTLGNGADPANTTVAPGGAATTADAFTFQTGGGTDTVTAVTVTLAPGTFASLLQLQITDDAGSTVYGSVNPLSDTPSIPLTTPITATTTSTQYKIRVRPESHALMPVPPGSSYALTARVSSWTSSNVNHAGSDSGGTTVTIDNLSPANVSSATATSGNTQVTLAWTNPPNSDLGAILVLRRAGSAVGDTPTEGATYSVGNTIGSSIVACVVAAPGTGCTDRGVTNGTVYHYRIFANDTNGNYATGAVPTGSPATPNMTTLGNGTDPANATIAPGGAATMADAFTFQSSGTDTITAVTVTLAPGTSAGVLRVEITNDAGSTVYGVVSEPFSSDALAIPLTTPITATTTSTQYKIRVTPNLHPDMPAPPGESYALTAAVSSWTGTNVQAGSDSGGTTITIDNRSPGNVTAVTTTGGDQQITVAWTNPADSDLQQVVVLRRAGAAVASTPAEGVNYFVGDTIGSSTVACVVTAPATSCTDAGLDNGTAYHYKLFARDTNRNYATGFPTASPVTPTVTTIDDGTPVSNATVAPGGPATMADAFTFQTRSGADAITSITLALAAGTSAGVSLVEITNSGGTIVYGSVSDPPSDAFTVPLSINIIATQTIAEYRIRVTPKSHAAMPAPPGTSYALTAHITDWSGSNAHDGVDSGNTIITMDNLSPGNVTNATATAASTQVLLAWTNPADSDLGTIVVLRQAGAAVTDTPVEGVTYSVGNTVGSSTVACVTAAALGCADVGLINGTDYHYEIFSQDIDGNYATGFVPTGSPATPFSRITVTPTSGLTTTEAGGTATFIVVLSSRPVADVTIGLSSSDTTEGTVSPSSLTFTSANWDIPQTVTVTGVDDDVDDGDVAYSIITAPATSAGGYDGQDASDVSVTNTNNDTAGIKVQPTGLTTTEAGGTATFTVALNTQPAADVTIGLNSSDTTEGTVSPASVTFTSANWSLQQTVTVTGVSDALADGNIPYTIVTAPAASSDGKYNGIDPIDVAVTNIDSNTVGIIVNPTSGLTTTEAGGTATFAVRLNTQPTADVTIGLSSSDTTEGTISLSSLTFTTSNWDTAQTVTVTGVDDDLDDGDVAYTIVTAAAVSDDGNYSGLNASDVSVTNIDNETSVITVTPTSGLTTTEAGGTATFTIVLTSQPTADVTIGLTSSNTAEGTVTPASVNLTPANWNLPQTVTVTGVDDPQADGNITYTIVTAPATSTDSNYSGRNASDVSVTNLDNDTAGITVTPTFGLTTSEAGGTATFTIVLTSQPTADVTIGVSSSDATEGTVSPASVIFTAANWNVAQTVTITGVNNPVDDGDIPYLIVTAPATSTDRDYSRLNASDVSVTNIDDDTAGIVVTPTSGLITSEIGGEAPTFTVVLTSQPTANVVIHLSSSDTTEGTVSPLSLTFTSANWNTPQTATVHGVNDVVEDGDIVYSIVTVATSADPKYAAIDPHDVTVTNLDSDTAGFFVSPIAGLTTTEAGGRAHFTVVLNTQPSFDVTIALSSSDPSEGTVSPASLTFTSDNWNTPQTADVTGVDDALDDGDITFTIVTGAAISADPHYSGLNPLDVSVINIDNDTAGITVSPIVGLTTTESGGTATFTVVLNSQPTANVTIGLTSTNTSEGTVNPASVTFTGTNWNTPQTVTVTGVDDLFDDGDVAYSIVTAPATSSDGSYNTLNALDVSVSNTDDDTAGFTLTPTSGLITTEAGGTATFTVVLRARPTANVTIGLISSDTAEGTVDKPSVTFTSDNWNTPQTVTITGVDDAFHDGDIAYDIVTTPASSSDSSYNGLSTGNVSVTNTDNDEASITVTPTFGLTTTEAGGTATFTVVLTSQPTADVTIGLTSSDTKEGTVSPASLTFTTGNWNTPRTVTVTGVDDFADDGDISFFVITAPATSGDSNYNVLDAADVLVTNTDNDATGFTVTPAFGLTTTEAGGTATYTVALTSQPTANVTFAVSSENTAEGTVAPASLTFTPANWNIPQTVTVTGVSDNIADGDIGFDIVNAPATSADSSYNGADPIDVAVINLDDDTSGIIITPLSGRITTEGLGTTTFTVRLRSQPTADVTIGLSSDDTTEGTVSPSTLTFTSINWNTEQTVTVTGVDDFLDDGDIAYHIVTAPAISSDVNYGGLNAIDVPVTNTDDDTAGVTVSPPTGLTTTEAGGPATFTVVLNAQPTDDVTIVLSSSDPTEGTVSPATITFTSVNWNVAQTATVTGVDDALNDGDIAYSIVMTLATSRDATYAGLNAIVVGVTNTDNDSGGGGSEVLTGTYVGNGADSRQITGLGFQPALVIIKMSLGQQAVGRTATMTGDVSKNMSTGETVTNAIQSLDASGFTVGNSLGTNFFFVTYQWVAWKAAPGEMVAGTYTGNGSALQSIAGLGFSPDIVFVLSGAADQPVHKERAGPAANAFTFDGVLSTNSIPTLGTDGFTVGNNVLANRAGTTYHYLAWNEIAGKIDVGTYTGNGADNRNIAGVGFQPDFLMVQTNFGLPPVAHSTAMGPETDASQFFNATANQANQIQVLQASGFQIGSAPESNGNPRTFTYAAWGRAAPTAVRMAAMSARRTEKGVVLEWRTGLEVDNLGFHVYRGPEAGRVRLSTSLIAGSGLQSPGIETSASHSYHWSDETAGALAPDVEYWVEEITLRGERIWHGPIRPGKSMENRSADAGVMAPPPPSPRLVERTLNRATPSKGVQVAAASAAPPAAGSSPQQETTGTVVAPAQRTSVPVRGPSPHDADAPVAPADPLQVQWSIASQAAVKIDIASRGWYRVTQPDLVAAGLRVPVDASLLQLFVNGVEQPMRVNGAANGRFDRRDSVEFYATGVDTPYSGTRTYWIVAGSSKGQRIPVVDGRQGGVAGPTSFPSSFELKPRSIFFGALENGDKENFFGPLIVPGESTSQVIDLPDVIAPAPADAELVVALQGVTDIDHRVGVRVNGVDVGEVTFSGVDTGVGTFAIAQALLIDGANTISLDARGGELDHTLLDYIRVTYHRRYRARANTLIFSADAGQQVTVAGFTDAGISVIDITGDVASHEVRGRVSRDRAGWSVTLAVPGTGPRTLVAVATGGEASPEALRANVPSTLNQAGQTGDIIMIAPAAFQAALAPLEAFRESQGYTVQRVDIEDVYDEFSFGMKTPQAIKDFLIRATAEWSRPPRFLLLVGNATQDPRDYFGFGEPDYVPTKIVQTGSIESASDDWFVDADDDGFADMAIVGRLPARSDVQVAAMVSKIIGYEQGAGGDWQRSVLLASDFDPTGDVDFAALIDQVREGLPEAYQVTNIREFIDQDAGAVLKARFGEGAGLVSYLGHGSVAAWRLDLLTAADVPALTNGSKLPLVVALTCLNGMFQSLFPEESLAEALVRAPNGGAVGVWASSGITSPQWQWRMNLLLYREIFQGGWGTIGEAMRAAKAIVGDPDVRRTWIYFGDPVTRFAGLPESSAATIAQGLAQKNKFINAGPTPKPTRQGPLPAVAPGGDSADSLQGTQLTAPAVQPAGVWVADFDGDSRDDVFAYDPSTGQWTLMRSGDDGPTFEEGNLGSWWEVSVTDLNGDGQADLLLWNAGSGQWMAYVFDRAGPFVYASGAWPAGGRGYPMDRDGDGRAEIFHYDADTGRWTLTGISRSGEVIEMEGVWEAGLSIASGDLDGDGRDDLLLYNPETGEVVRRLSRGSMWQDEPSGGWPARGLMVGRRP